MNDLFSASVNIISTIFFSYTNINLILKTGFLLSTALPSKRMKKKREKCFYKVFLFCCCKVIILEWKDFHFALIFEIIFESPSTLYGRKSILKYFFFIFPHLLYDFFYFHSASLSFFAKSFHTFCLRINFLFGVFTHFSFYTICLTFALAANSQKLKKSLMNNLYDGLIVSVFFLYSQFAN